MLSALLSSCDNNSNTAEEDIFSKNGVNEQIRYDFRERTGVGIGITEIHSIAYNNTVEILYQDLEGADHKCLYYSNVWQYDIEYIPEEELDATLPLPVKKAFYSLDFDGEIQLFPDWGDRYYRIERRGFQHGYYEFLFHYLLENGSWYTSYALILEDGKVISANHDGHNNAEYFYDFDDALSFIRGRYQGCVPLGYTNEVGENLFFIEHEGIVKQVYFRNNYKQFDNILTAWKETIYSLPLDTTIPEDVLEQLPSTNYTELFYGETPYSGNAYGFKIGDTIYWI